MYAKANFGMMSMEPKSASKALSNLSATVLAPEVDLIRAKRPHQERHLGMSFNPLYMFLQHPLTTTFGVMFVFSFLFHGTLTNCNVTCVCTACVRCVEPGMKTRNTIHSKSIRARRWFERVI